MSASGSGGEVSRRPTRKPWVRKRRRVLLTFGVLAVLIAPAIFWRARLAGEVRDSLREIKAAGRPASLAELNQAADALPPDLNGATCYRNAAAAFRDAPAPQATALPFRGRTSLPAGQALPAELMQAMESLVALNSQPLALLVEAAEFPECRYIPRYETPVQKLDLSHQASAEQLNMLACCSAVLAAERGDHDLALRSLGAALALARSLESDGLYSSLQCQWRIESQILTVLQRLMGTDSLSTDALAPFREQFSVEHRIALWRRMCDVEQAVFLSRIGRGPRRGIVRSLLVAGGLGDINLRDYMALMADLRAGFGLKREEQQPLIDRRNVLESRMDRHPMVYLTLSLNLPPASWAYTRARWDEAVVAQIALALYSFRKETGRYPEALVELNPGWMASVPEALASGEILNYSREGNGFRIWHTLDEGKVEDCWLVAPPVPSG